MSSDQPEHFFIVLHLSDGELQGHSVVSDMADLDKALAAPENNEEENVTPTGDATTFEEVFRSFASVVTTYRNFLKFTMALAPVVSGVIAERTIGEFAKSKGMKRDDLSTSERLVFEMGNNTWRELSGHHDEILAALRGASHLPEVMLIGLVSAYDSFLAKLLTVIFLRHEAIILTSDKAIKFSELSQFKSIEEARLVLIDREIESVLRDSHQEHFKWMETKFSIRLKDDLPVFPKFVEICERRNLLTHTGGNVSAKYIANCKDHNVNLDGVELGAKLTVSNEYYSAAVNVVCEIGIKLCYVLWRKFAKDEREKADGALNEFCYNLIVRRNYSNAEAILSFSTQVLSKKGSDHCRRMMLINQANAIRLQKREVEAKKLLDSEDWSAVNDTLAIGVAAVRGDVDGVVALLEKIGPDGDPNAEAFRTWPVFRGLRSNAKVIAAFQSVFGEPIVRPKAAEITLPLAENTPLSPDVPQHTNLH
jgi:hypothetical protein